MINILMINAISSSIHVAMSVAFSKIQKWSQKEMIKFIPQVGVGTVPRGYSNKK